MLTVCFLAADSIDRFQCYDNPMKDLSYSPSTDQTVDQKRIERVLERAKEVFIDAEKAEAWMNTPNLALGDRPVSLLVSEAGENSVLEILNSIEYGATA